MLTERTICGDFEVHRNLIRLGGLKMADFNSLVVQDDFLSVFKALTGEGDVKLGAALPAARENAGELRRCGLNARAKKKANNPCE